MEYLLRRYKVHLTPQTLEDLLWDSYCISNNSHPMFTIYPHDWNEPIICVSSALCRSQHPLSLKALAKDTTIRRSTGVSVAVILLASKLCIRLSVPWEVEINLSGFTEVHGESLTTLLPKFVKQRRGEETRTAILRLCNLTSQLVSSSKSMPGGLVILPAEDSPQSIHTASTILKAIELSREETFRCWSDGRLLVSA